MELMETIFLLIRSNFELAEEVVKRRLMDLANFMKIGTGSSRNV